MPVNNTTLVKQAGRFKKDTKNTLKQLVIANQSMYYANHLIDENIVF